MKRMTIKNNDTLTLTDVPHVPVINEEDLMALRLMGYTLGLTIDNWSADYRDYSHLNVYHRDRNVKWDGWFGLLVATSNFFILDNTLYVIDTDDGEIHKFGHARSEKDINRVMNSIARPQRTTPTVLLLLNRCK